MTVSYSNTLTKSRVIYFDILNIFACFAVIFLHHNGIVHNYDVNTIAWKQALGFEVAFYWAVPVFFMLSGATLLNYREKYTTKSFFSKRLSRAVFPFLLWSIILLAHAYITGNFPYKNIQEIVSAIVNTNIPYGHIYWFFIPLISLYCIIPVLSLLKDNRSILWYIVLFLFTTHSVLPLLFDWIGLSYNWSISFPMGGYVVLCCILGYLFSTQELTKRQRFIIYVLGIFSGIFRYWGTYHYSLQNGHLDSFLFGYHHFHSILLALAIFIFVKYNFTGNKFSFFIAKISSCSLGIYLIHWIVMEYELSIFKITPDNVYWRFLGTFLTYTICLCFVLTIKRIPYLRSIFP